MTRLAYIALMFFLAAAAACGWVLL